VAKYAESFGVQKAWLIIFDRDTNKPWEEKIYFNSTTVDNKTISIVGC
jgi:hypothetical protein